MYKINNFPKILVGTSILNTKMLSCIYASGRNHFRILAVGVQVVQVHKLLSLHQAFLFHWVMISIENINFLFTLAVERY